MTSFELEAPGFPEGSVMGPSPCSGLGGGDAFAVWMKLPFHRCLPSLSWGCESSKNTP